MNRMKRKANNELHERNLLRPGKTAYPELRVPADDDAFLRCLTAKQLHVPLFPQSSLTTSRLPDRNSGSTSDLVDHALVEREGYNAAGSPNQMVIASTSRCSFPSPTQATQPSGRINTAVGASTVPITGSSQGPSYLAFIN